MTTLYDMAGRYMALADLADDPNMPEDALTDTLDGIEGEIQDKAQALLQVVSNLTGDTDAIDAEVKRLQVRKKLIQNRADRLRQYLHDNMVITGINKIECPLFNITLSKARPMVVIKDASEIPLKFTVSKTTTAPVKKDILAALKAGEDVPGCLLGESKRALLIK